MSRRVLILAALALGAVAGGVQGQVSDDPAETGRLRVAPPRWNASVTARPAIAAFAIGIDGFRVPHRVMALHVLPGARVQITSDEGPQARLTVSDGAGRVRAEAGGSWSWDAPDRAGFYAVRVVAEHLRDTIHVTFMVARLAAEVRDGTLNGYRIGAYRPRPSSMSASYEPPTGFVEARPNDADMLVSPNFRLGQFLCKQPGDPKYLLVSPRLLMKLEALLAAVNRAGYRTSSLAVMSSFRTPAYNRAIGNTTDFSRHLWGDAADVYVDGDGDGRMDDLNGDLISDLGDARWLAQRVEEMMAMTDDLEPGGLAVYPANAAHGPFVHIDARGYRARW
jgi:hypothetical protein